MNLSVGIVGLPNVGKSSLFNALMGRAIANTENYPFCTIEPNVGIVEVPDPRLTKLADLAGITKRVPAVVKFVDIAGLVKGAHQGEGLGNKFLSYIREVSAICQVLRDFNDENVERAGALDPDSDRLTIDTELLLADLDAVEKRLSGLESALKNPKARNEQAKYEVAKKIQVALAAGTPVRDMALTDQERELSRDFFLLTAKPCLYVRNVDEDKLAGELAKGEFVISAKIEAELAELPEEERKEYLEGIGLKESGLERLIQKSYQLLGLATFFTAGQGGKEARAWTIEASSTAPQAAGAIHSDFERGFIAAELVSYEDLTTAGSYATAKERGQIRTEGKDYVMEDGDVVEFRFSV